MKRRLVALLALLVMLLSGCRAVTNEELYERAQLYLGDNDYERAATLFAQLGEYRDSADYALYARSLLAWQQEDLTLARNGLKALHPFKSSGRYLAYLDALDAMKAGRAAEALAGFEALGAFGDSAKQARLLRAALPSEQTDDAVSRDDADVAPLPSVALEQQLTDWLLAQLAQSDLSEALSDLATKNEDDHVEDTAEPDNMEQDENEIDLSVPAEDPDEADKAPSPLLPDEMGMEDKTAL